MILNFHRVLAQADPLMPSEPVAAFFEQQLNWLSSCCNILPLSDAIKRLESGSLPARSVSITFDDGYLNNLELAAPILKKHNIPATVFVAVDAVERGIMWNDIVYEAVRQDRHKLDLSLVDAQSELNDQLSDRQLIHRIIDIIKYKPLNERLEVAEALFRSATNRNLPSLMMKPEQLVQLQKFGIEIGAHTVNHPILTQLDSTTATEEIAGSRQWLEKITGVPPSLFAYPNGKRGDDYTDEHALLVKECGFSAAVSTNWGAATSRSSLFELPRFSPWELTQKKYVDRLIKTLIQSYL